MALGPTPKGEGLSDCGDLSLEEVGRCKTPNQEFLTLFGTKQGQRLLQRGGSSIAAHPAAFAGDSSSGIVLPGRAVTGDSQGFL